MHLKLIIKYNWKGLFYWKKTDLRNQI